MVGPCPILQKSLHSRLGLTPELYQATGNALVSHHLFCMRYSNEWDCKGNDDDVQKNDDVALVVIYNVIMAE